MVTPGGRTVDLPPAVESLRLQLLEEQALVRELQRELQRLSEQAALVPRPDAAAAEAAAASALRRMLDSDAARSKATAEEAVSRRRDDAARTEALRSTLGDADESLQALEAEVAALRRTLQSERAERVRAEVLLKNSAGGLTEALAAARADLERGAVQVVRAEQHAEAAERTARAAEEGRRREQTAAMDAQDASDERADRHSEARRAAAEEHKQLKAELATALAEVLASKEAHERSLAEARAEAAAAREDAGKAEAARAALLSQLEAATAERQQTQQKLAALGGAAASARSLGEVLPAMTRLLGRLEEQHAKAETASFAALGLAQDKGAAEGGAAHVSSAAISAERLVVAEAEVCARHDAIN